MSKHVYGIATETIPFGALVLCRGFRVSLASEKIANGKAARRPVYRGDKPNYEPGQHVTVEPIDGLGGRSLQALADAPIMDACKLFLPAGKLSMAETRAREAANLEVAS
jgi:hypothetical protein